MKSDIIKHVAKLTFIFFTGFISCCLQISKGAPSFSPREQGSPKIAKGTNKTSLIYFIEIELLTYNRRSIFLTKQKSNN
jgi:hypothetical protein